MPGLFQGLELAKRALLTHQSSLQTIGHNIANINTPGYRRQRVSISSTQPEFTTQGSIGTGVSATDVRHIRDLFLGDQYRKDRRSLGQWEYKEKTLSQVEAQFGEPNDNALSDILSEFWGSWSSLARGDAGSRETIAENARLLVNGLQTLAGNLISLQDSTDRELVAMTSDINAITAEIARVNHQIKRSELGGQSANDLRDVRDQLVDDLSVFVDVNTHETPIGDFMVFIGSFTVVDQDNQFEIATAITNIDGHAYHDLVWKGSKVEIRNLNGQMKGLLDSRDEIIPRYLEKLDEVARAIVTEVNALHRSGYGADGSTGVDFFDPRFISAATISISFDILADSSKIAASQSGDPGDTRVAKAIADLSEAEILGRNTVTVGDFYNGLVGGLGIEAREARSSTESYELLVNQVVNERLSVEGVSLDEEMTNMIRFQRAYDAAARVITTMDQALDTVINNMGIVGR
ncbi:MAG: flagellar hook-associated protein FlgK [bacterium]